MRTRKTSSHRASIALAIGAWFAQVGGCGPSSGGIDDTGSGGAESAGGVLATNGGTTHAGGAVVGSGGSEPSGGSSANSGASSQAGSNAEAGAGSPNSAQGGAAGDSGAPALGGAVNGGALGSNGGTQGGTTATSGGATQSGGSAAGGAQGGSISSGGTLSYGGRSAWPTHCIYTDDIPIGGAGAEPEPEPLGEGGAGPAPTITTPKNGFAGTYLADADGRALYIYGADTPGDCTNPPVSNCTSTDCMLSWPPFKVVPRILAAGLDDSLFGSIRRLDGSVQTTYRGWPLYYYKSDAEAGDVKGQAVGKIWQLAQISLPNIIILRMGSPRYLADAEGYVLYVANADTKASGSSPPVSACTGACLSSYDPFSPPYASPVTYLASGDFSYFARPDGIVQLAYKGAPLYHAWADSKPASTTGVIDGWTAAVP